MDKEKVNWVGGHPEGIALMELNWDLLKKDFEFDGSFLDIYVLNTTVEDCKKLFEFLKASEYQIEISGASESFNWSDINIANYYATSPDERISTTINISDDGVTICWFLLLSENGMEFNIDPREILDMKKLEIVLRFMKKMALLLKKEVVLTPENFPEKSIFVCDPEAGDIRYVPA